MRHWWVTLALLLSLGVNIGLVAAVAAGRWAERRIPDPVAPAPGLPAGGRELPDPVTIELPEEPAAEGGEEDGGEPPPGRGSSAAPEAEEPAVTVGVDGWHPDPVARPGGRRHPGEERSGAGHEPPIGRLADHLGLEGERRERFVALQRRFVAAHLAERAERARLGAALRHELLAEEPDRDRIDALLAGLADAYLASQRATTEVILASRELLDAGQQRVYFRFLEHLREHGAGPHGPPRSGPRGRRPR